MIAEPRPHRESQAPVAFTGGRRLRRGRRIPAPGRGREASAPPGPTRRGPLATPAPSLLAFADREALGAAYRTLLPLGPGVETHLRGVVEDALAHPGSLYRAQVAWGILAAHGVDAEAARAQTIAIEYFHTASLLFDDLPAMDDAGERRGRPCPHRTWGEASAMLGALALITRGYELLWRSLGGLTEARRQRAAALVGETLGLGGILNGQALDLQFAAAERSAADVLRVAEGKTVSLIRLTLLLPAITAGAGEADVERLERLARAWGLAYQVLDDFKDCLMSRDETGKSADRDAALGRPNLPRVAGWQPALERLEDLLAEAGDLLAELGGGGAWRPLRRLQAVLAGELADVRERLPRRA
jgi:geranylgeranyl pyrophosphate synthase